MSKIKMPKKENILFCLPIILLSLALILGFYNLSSTIYKFPLRPSDISVHMARFYFLTQYGFHGYVPNWYDGYVLFLSYPPFFSYYVLPFYLLASDISASFLTAITSLFILIFIATFFLCKTQKISFLKSITLFFLVFAGLFSLSNFFEWVRAGELVGWVFFLSLLILILRYKEIKLDYKFTFIFTILLIFIILSYFYFVVFSGLLILSFLWIKSKQEKFIILLCLLISVLLTSFWWFPYAMNYFFGEVYEQNALLISISSPGRYMNRIWMILIPIFFWLAVYSCNKGGKKNKNNIILIMPYLVLSALIFTGIAGYMPILSEIGAYSYCLIFLLISLIFFFQKKSYKTLLDKGLIILILIFFPLVSIVIFLYPVNEFFWHGYLQRPLVNEMVSVIPTINGSFIIMPEMDYREFYFDGRPFYCYGAIYYNLSTPSGWDPPAAKASIIEAINAMEQAVHGGNCSAIVSIGRDIKVDEIISYKPYCNQLKNCTGLEVLTEKEYICSFHIITEY